jgi:hypothetical protein
MRGRSDLDMSQDEEGDNSALGCLLVIALPRHSHSSGSTWLVAVRGRARWGRWGEMRHTAREACMQRTRAGCRSDSDESRFLSGRTVMNPSQMDLFALSSIGLVWRHATRTVRQASLLLFLHDFWCSSRGVFRCDPATSQAIVWIPAQAADMKTRSARIPTREDPKQYVYYPPAKEKLGGHQSACWDTRQQ